MTQTAAGAFATPADLAAGLDWIAASVPGTVADALRTAGRFDPHAPVPLHGHDHWYRTTLHGAGPRILRFEGLAGVAEVFVDGRSVLRSDSMFVSHDVEIKANGTTTLAICFRSLDRVLQSRRRGRWRPRLVRNPAIRTVRQTLLGQMPGWCPDIHAIGPWRAIEMFEQRPLEITLHTAWRDGSGHVAITLAGSDATEATLHVAGQRIPLHRAGEALHGAGPVPGVAPWWPHTHGKPALHAASIELGKRSIELSPIGFRSIAVDRGADGQGFALLWNGAKLFCRGAVWTPPDLAALPADAATLRPALLRARDGGMNMLRLPGIGTYESDDFHALCDELGIMVWQDFMFASLDYPAADVGFAALVAQEAEQLLRRTGGSPSLAVLCGGSEVAQQAAMLGLEARHWSNALFDDVLPAAVARLRPDVPYVSHSPGGGDLPFLPGAGIAHYYGVGAYLRPLDDPRTANVRFASECLAISNVGAGAVEIGLTEPAWKAGIPRDGGAPWDFEDVRDHYLQVLSGQDARRLRTEDPQRYLDVSRAVSCELAEALFGHWRRPDSGCAGGLVLLLQDMRPGAGWGVIDVAGAKKPIWHALRRAWGPARVVISDEGLNGLDLHVLNDGPEPLLATLTLVCLRNGAVAVIQTTRDISVPAHGALRLSAAALLGRFFDASYAYRFGPRAHSVTVAELLDGERVIAQAVHVPDAPRLLPREDVGLTAQPVADAAGGWSLHIAVRRFAQYVRVEHDGWSAEDQWFHVSPLRPRVLRLLPDPASGPTSPNGAVLALNAYDPTPYRLAA